jgi:hypothetical protein
LPNPAVASEDIEAVLEKLESYPHSANRSKLNGTRIARTEEQTRQAKVEQLKEEVAWWLQGRLDACEPHTAPRSRYYPAPEEWRPVPEARRPRPAERRVPEQENDVSDQAQGIRQLILRHRRTVRAAIWLMKKIKIHQCIPPASRFIETVEGVLREQSTGYAPAAATHATASAIRSHRRPPPKVTTPDTTHPHPQPQPQPQPQPSNGAPTGATLMGRNARKSSKKSPVKQRREERTTPERRTALTDAEVRVKEAEARAKEAEARAKEAEARASALETQMRRAIAAGASAPSYVPEALPLAEEVPGAPRHAIQGGATAPPDSDSDAEHGGAKKPSIRHKLAELKGRTVAGTAGVVTTVGAAALEHTALHAALFQHPAACIAAAGSAAIGGAAALAKAKK